MSSNIIAVLWDFDKTLITGYMQDPIFKYYGVDPVQFWDEVNALPDFHSKDGDEELLVGSSLYLNHILTYVRAGIFRGLNNDMLRRFGAMQDLAPGVPEIFERIRNFCQSHEVFQKGEIQLEHYVISTGLRQVILGSKVAPYMRFVWGCEFLHRVAPPGYLQKKEALEQDDDTICDIGYVVDHTTKTRALFEINKGVREDPRIDINMKIPEEKRRIPFSNMIYIADGPGDIPSLSVLRKFGGRTIGVYQPSSEQDKRQAELMLAQERVHWIGPADYRPGTPTYARILQEIESIARFLAAKSGERRSRRDLTEEHAFVAPPKHLYKPE